MYGLYGCLSVLIVLRVVAMRGEREEGAPVNRAEDDMRRIRFIIIGITACTGM